MGEAAGLGQVEGDIAHSASGGGRSEMFWIGALWVIVLTVGGLFVVDVIAAYETEPDECYAYGYGYGPGGYGCNPLLDDAFFEASQTEDLVDRQTVRIDGFLFSPNEQFGIAQCSGVAFVIDEDPAGISACDISNTALGFTNDQGEVSVDLNVRRIINTPDGGEVDCALPDSLCVIAGGTLGGDLLSTSEAAFVSIAFDPDTPPVPPPTIDLEVIHVAADSMTIEVECLRATRFSLDTYLRQERNGLTGSANGYVSEFEETPRCANGPVRYEIELLPGNRRIGRGDVTWSLWASASDGVESVYEELEGEFFVKRTPRAPYVTVDEQGTDISVEYLGISGRGGDQVVSVAVSCATPSTYLNVSVNISQWAWLDRIYAYGYQRIDDCTGRNVLEFPIEPSNGRLSGWTAQLSVSAYGYSFDENGDYTYDRAEVAEPIRLRGSVAAELPEYEENPDSRITIDRVSQTGVSGTIECDEPVTVSLNANASQYQWRIIRNAYAFVGDTIECDGTTSFDVEWNQRIRRTTTAVILYASAYTVVDCPVYPNPYPTAVPTTTTVASGAPVPGSRPPIAEIGIEADGAAPPGGLVANSRAFPYEEGTCLDNAWFDNQGETGRIRR